MAAASPLAPIEEIIAEARAGRMFVLVDDEDRENEGDLIVPAAACDAGAINFMAKHGRGLICLALDRARVEALGLPLMAQRNRSRHATAFTVSIEAAEGVTTGISAADRARTIAAAIDPVLGAEGIVTPGHIFPLMARDGGVLVRAGHTEASVDIARLAGLHPSAVICEIMNDDGSMARLPDLISYAARHGLKIGQIRDLIAFRRRNERFVSFRTETRFDSAWGGDWRVRVYVDSVSGGEHVALVKGEVPGAEPPLVRMHALNVFEDILGDTLRGHQGVLARSMREIADFGRGVVVLIRDPSPTSWSAAAAARTDGRAESELRDYGIGAQILRDLGIRDMILLSNTHKTIIGLDGYDLHIVAERAVPPARGAEPGGCRND
ncbi:3,4-dihydroxy-2-butanone 4-phosphate synthase [uncultured Alphaproteobacteria bacterium]|uniref:3,4-dihydroxy-2-butanone 4-phosphate synthase n=1 Tax=uncultured Alphaproteobacteria bacterium TaxID=91750 RepID=A0A212J5D4_9PROT|nr:3,4-dihydroxy-2-butanone 4-phosphate synthase [uncultured Alphaproteobacteria bacterium]